MNICKSTSRLLYKKITYKYSFTNIYLAKSTSIYRLLVQQQLTASLTLLLECATKNTYTYMQRLH